MVIYTDQNVVIVQILDKLLDGIFPGKRKLLFTVGILVIMALGKPVVIIDEIAEENEHIVVGKVDVDAQTELATQFQVYSIPTLVVLKNGKILKQATGARSKAQILDMLP